MQLKNIAVIGAALCSAAGVAYALWNEPTEQVVTSRDEIKEQWVFQRRLRIADFNEDFNRGFINRNVSIRDVDFNLFTEKYAGGILTVGLETTEGFKLVGKLNGTTYGWSFMPPDSQEIYSAVELREYLIAVKNNQSSRLFTR